MSFSELKLTPQLLVNLYKNVLISTSLSDSSNDNNKIGNENKITFLGDNKSKVSIIVNDESAAFIAEEKLQFLINLLSACKLNIADVAIINISNKEIDYHIIKDQLTPSYIILMGVDVKKFKLPIIFSKNKVQQFDNCNMLITSDFNELMGSSDTIKTEKRNLWNALKNLFSLN